MELLNEQRLEQLSDEGVTFEKDLETLEEEHKEEDSPISQTALDALDDLE